MVPQDGFLFAATIEDNIRYGRPGATAADAAAAIDELGLRDWLDGLPAGMQTPVGQRGAAGYRSVSGSWLRWPGPRWPIRAC